MKKQISFLLALTMYTTLIHAEGLWVDRPVEPQFSTAKKQLSSVEKQIAKINKEMDRRNKKWKLNGHTINQSLYAQKSSSTFARYDLCQLGVLTSVTKDSKEVLKVAQPLNYATMEMPDKAKHYVGTAYGPSINLGTTILYAKDTDRDKSFSYLQQLKILCVQRDELNRVVQANQGLFTSIDETAMYQTGTLIPEIKSELNDIHKGGFPVVLSTPADQVSVALLRGRESFAMRWRQLEELTHDRTPKNIRIQVLHWGGDEASISIAEKLIQLKQLGHNPILYIDTLSPFADIRNMPKKLNTIRLYYKMMAAGIQVNGFNCSNFSHPLLGSQIEDLREALQYSELDEVFAHFRKNMHEKIWSIDGKDVIMGGMNILNEYFAILPEGAGNWKDQDFIVKGTQLNQQIKDIVDRNIEDYDYLYKAADEVSCLNPYAITDSRYNKFWKQQMDNLYKYHIQVYLLTFGKLRMDKYMDVGNGSMDGYDFTSAGVPADRLASKNVAIQEINYLKQGIIRNVESNGLGYKSQYALNPTFHPVKGLRWVPNRPKTYFEHYISDTLIHMIDSAKSEVWLVNAYFTPYARMVEALQRAAARGVEIHIMTNGEATNDLPIMTPVQRDMYKSLMDISNKLHIHEWEGRFNYAQDSAQRRGMLHAKFLIVDKKLISGGSYNIDATSEFTNSEVVMATESEQLAEEMLKNVQTDYLPFSREISYQEALQFRSPEGTDSLMMKISKKFRFQW